jgi:hypothetical protein
MSTDPGNVTDAIADATLDTHDGDQIRLVRYDGDQPVAVVWIYRVSTCRKIGLYDPAASERDRDGMARCVACEVWGAWPSGSRKRGRPPGPPPIPNCRPEELRRLRGLFNLIAGAPLAPDLDPGNEDRSWHEIERVTHGQPP